MRIPAGRCQLLLEGQRDTAQTSTRMSRCSGPVSCRTRRFVSLRPLPVADLRHIVAMLADVKLVTLHRGPIALRGFLHLVAEPWDSLDSIERELITVKIVQHHHVEGGGGRALLPIATD